MGQIKDGISELSLFLKNIFHVFRILFNLIRHNPKSVFIFIARLIRRLNETLAVYFANYRLNREDLIKFHEYFSTELKKLKTRTDGLHRILNTKLVNDSDGFSIFLHIHKQNQDHAVEGLDFYRNLTGDRFELIVLCSDKSPVFPKIKEISKTDSKIKLVSEGIDDSDRFQLDKLFRTLPDCFYKFVIFARIEDWPRPDLLYRLQQTINLVVDPTHYSYICEEVAFSNHNQVYDVSRYTTFKSDMLPYYFLKSSFHMLCVNRDVLLNKNDISSKETIFELGLALDSSGLKIYTLPFELYHYRINSETNDLVNEKILKRYFESLKLPLELKKSGSSNPIYFNFVPNIVSSQLIHVIVLYKDHSAVTLECARRLLVQTHKKLQITFVDNGSQDQTIKRDLINLGFEVIVIDEPFNYSRLNNLGVAQSNFKGCNSYLFLNNDVYLEPDAIEQMVKWIGFEDVGAVGSLLTFEDGTIQHAGLFVDKVMNIYVPWEHQDIGLTIESSKTGRALRPVQAVTGACMLVRRDVFEKVNGWDEDNYPISFSDTDLCRKIRRLGKKIIFTPESKGIHLESKTRGYSLIEDYECSSWLFWTTENKQSRNKTLMGHHFLDIPDLFRDS